MEFQRKYNYCIYLLHTCKKNHALGHKGQKLLKRHQPSRYQGTTLVSERKTVPDTMYPETGIKFMK